MSVEKGNYFGKLWIELFKPSLPRKLWEYGWQNSYPCCLLRCEIRRVTYGYTLHKDFKNKLVNQRFIDSLAWDLSKNYDSLKTKKHKKINIIGMIGRWWGWELSLIITLKFTAKNKMET